jgi:hypothetical protein
VKQPSDKRVELVWNKGIAALCDRRFPDEFPGGGPYLPVPRLAGARATPRMPEDLIPDTGVHRRIQEGDLVWVRLSWLKSFVKQVLPFVNASLTLVTADSDTSVPSGLGSLARRVLDCPKVTHWYTQNYDGSMASDRISPLPIGVDFHMLSERPVWGEEVSSPGEQEQALLATTKALPHVRERIEKVYIDFGWQSGWGFGHDFLRPRLQGARLRESRHRVGKMLRGNEAVYFQPGPLPRSEMWRRRGQYAFVLSPHGMGLDCHRTWEALALGHIVLVPSSSLDSLFIDLPVVPLRSWRDVTPANLKQWLLRYQDAGGDYETLRSSYWVRRMRTKEIAAEGCYA